MISYGAYKTFQSDFLHVVTAPKRKAGIMEQMTKVQNWEEKPESEEHPSLISLLTWSF